MSAVGIKAGRAYVELGVNDRFSSALKAAQAKLKAYGASVRTAGYAVTAAATAAAAPLILATKQFAERGSAINDMTKRTGMSAEAVSALGFAADMTGSSMETLEKGVRAMQRNLAEAASGNESAIKSFTGLGLSVSDLMAMTPDQQLAAVGKAIAAIPDPALRTAAAMDIMSRSGAELIPMFQELDGLTAQAREFRITMSGADAAAADELGDALDMAMLSARGLMMAIGAALGPAVTDLSSRLASLAATTAEWIDRNREAVVAAAAITIGAAAAGVALIGLGAACSALSAAIGLLTATMAAAGAVLGVVSAGVTFLLTPLGLVVAGLVAAAGAFLYFSGVGEKSIDRMKGRFGELKDDATTAISGIAAALNAGDFELAFDIALKAVQIAWIQFTNELKAVWRDTWDSIAGTVDGWSDWIAQQLAELTAGGGTMEPWQIEHQRKLLGATGEHWNAENNVATNADKHRLEQAREELRMLRMNAKDKEVWANIHRAEARAARESSQGTMPTGGEMGPFEIDLSELDQAMATLGTDVGDDIADRIASAMQAKADFIDETAPEVFGDAFGSRGTFSSSSGALQSLQSVSGNGWKAVVDEQKRGLEEQKKTNEELKKLRATVQNNGGLQFGV